jgi:hypothetical protein
MGGSNKTQQNQTSTFTPTPQAMNFYQDVLGKSNAALSPYNPATEKQVAGFTDPQTQAFQQIAGNQGVWQPNVNAGSQMVQNAGQGIAAGDIANFYNPYQQDVINSTLGDINQQDAMARRAYTANQTAQGGLGGSGFGIGRAMLNAEQSRNRNSTVANLRNTGWQQALAAAQADKTRGLAAGQASAGIGQLMSQLGFNDAGQMLASGNQQQAQQQAQLDASSTNATNKQLYPMQQAQWLAGIGSGIGPLMGGTTQGSGTATTSQGKGVGNVIGAGLTLASMASDERVKENTRPIGFTFDGQKIYKFNYKGDPRTQIGLIAQDVEQEHPEAVHTRGDGVKMVNYDQALPMADGGMALPQGLMGWAPIRPANVNAPSLSGVDAPAMPQDGFDPQAAWDMGKKARGGIENLMGLGSSVMPAASSPAGGALAASGMQGAGGGLGSLAGLFGFQDGGFVPTPEEMYALEMQESGGRDIVNPRSGAFGPRQIMPATAQDPGFGVAPLRPGASVDEQRDFSNAYFGAMLKRYGGDRDAARIAYNGGPARADAWMKSGRDDSVIPAESANYYKSIAARLGNDNARSVAKGMSTSERDMGGERYTSKADRATGGLLKRTFGIDFNPLNLTEPERRALMVAGLSMMSSGDVGRGGLMGMQYLAGSEAGEREAGLDRSKLAYQMRKDADDLALRTRAQGLAETKEERDARQDAEAMEWRKGEVERENKKFTPDQKEYEAAKAEGYEGTFTEFQRAQKASHAAAPESVREYEHAVTQGFEGTLQDWLKWKAGNKPLTNADKKAVLEADEYQETGKSAIENLNKALELNQSAYSGPLASERGYTTSTVGNERGIATQTVENLVYTQAVEQLKRIFGGMPTEGERAILLDLQGSVSKHPKVREEIWKRGIKAAERRLNLAKDQSEGIRSGEYWKPKAGGAEDVDAPKPVKTETIRPRATGPNGEVIEWDGSAWVPAQ